MAMESCTFGPTLLLLADSVSCVYKGWLGTCILCFPLFTKVSTFTIPFESSFSFSAVVCAFV